MGQNNLEIFLTSLAGDAANRWFDKVCYMVYRNGLCGANGEHSQADAIVAVIMWDWVCAQVAQKEVAASAAFERSALTTGAAAPHRQLPWTVSTAITKSVEA